MSKVKIRILSVARDDIGEIYYYIAVENPESALAMTEKIIKKIETLKEFPHVGKIVPEKELAQQEYRMLIINNYIAFYRVIDDEVIIYRVLHGMRDYYYLLKGEVALHQ